MRSELLLAVLSPAAHLLGRAVYLEELLGA